LTTLTGSIAGPSGIEHSVPRCVNCDQEAEFLVRVQAYEVCQPCEALSALPWWER